jgi:hypothetical protein
MHVIETCKNVAVIKVHISFRNEKTDEHDFKQDFFVKLFVMLDFV